MINDTNNTRSNPTLHHIESVTQLSGVTITTVADQNFRIWNLTSTADGEDVLVDPYGRVFKFHEVDDQEAKFGPVMVQFVSDIVNAVTG